MYNDSVNKNKLIWVYLPARITMFQYIFIEMLERKYGTFLKKTSKKLYEFNNDFLVGVSVRDDNKVALGDSFDCVIKFINENSMLKNSDYVVNEKYIIGDILESDYNRKKI